MPDAHHLHDINAFAAALDQASRGGTGSRDPLGSFAHRFEQAAAEPGLSAAERDAIWERLMAGHPRPEPLARPARPGQGGGAAGTLPASTIRPAPARSRRPDRRSLRFLPDMGGFSTATLIVAIVALIGGVFAQLDSDNERGFLPSVFATEFAPATASASLVASPVASPLGTDGGGFVWMPSVQEPDGGAP